MAHSDPGRQSRPVCRLSPTHLSIFAPAVESLESGLVLNSASCSGEAEVLPATLAVARNIAHQQGRSFRRHNALEGVCP